MKTRAILQTSPFSTQRESKLTAVVQVGGEVTQVWLRREHAALRKGDPITVERHGSEWRAV